MVRFLIFKFFEIYNILVRLAGPFQVMSRLFTCMNGAPLNQNLANRARESLKLLEVISEWFHESIPAVLTAQLPAVLQYLDGT